MKRSHKHKLRRGVPLDELEAQYVQGAVEGVHRAVPECTERSIAVTEIVGAAENDDDILAAFEELGI